MNQEWMQKLTSDEEAERLYAVEDIADSGQKQYVSELVKTLVAETSQAVRNSIISALQKLDNPREYSQIFELFSSEDAFLRNAAMSILSSYGEDALHFLASNLDHSNREVRKLIIDCVMEIENAYPAHRATALDIMRACLHDPEANVVITAVEYLGKLNDEESLPEFLELLHQSNEPMLISFLLDTILKMGNPVIFEEVANILLTRKLATNDLYFPQVLKCVAESNQVEQFEQMTADIKDISLYADDILKILDSKRGKDSQFIQSSVGLLKKLLKANLSANLKYVCARMLLELDIDEVKIFTRQEVSNDKELNQSLQEEGLV